MTLDEFFTGFETSRPLFDAVRLLVESLGPAEIRVSKSQIAFAHERAFAWAWVPSRYLKQGDVPLVLSLALERRDGSPRWKQIVEPAPGRFMHHLELRGESELDDQVLAWLREAREAACPERFYHGTKADLKPGDLIKPGLRPNFGNLERKTTWVYLTGTLEAAIWGAELARGEGPGRVYTVEPTGPIADDPDLTDKRFPGNPTKSYCSQGPLRVTGEVTDWQGHSPEARKAMNDALENVARTQAALVARIPSKADFDKIHDLSDELAREWASDAQYLGCMLLMLIRGADVEISSALEYHSRSRGETHTIHLPRSTDMESRSQETDVTLSGRATDVTAWREGWAAALESCVTEIGLASEVRVFIAVDADHDKLTFDVNAEGPDLSWHRNLQLMGGVLSDRERGEVWYFGPAPS